MNHYIYTYQDWLFIQMCNHQAPMHCSRVQGKMHASGFFCCCANQADSSLLSLHKHLSRLAIHTGVQPPGIHALQQVLGQIACLGAFWQPCNQADSRHVPRHMHKDTGRHVVIQQEAAACLPVLKAVISCTHWFNSILSSK